MKSLKKLLNRKAAPPCEYCTLPGKRLTEIDLDGETALFLTITGGYLQIFDDNMPGINENIKFNFCPMCGQKLG